MERTIVLYEGLMTEGIVRATVGERLMMLTIPLSIRTRGFRIREVRWSAMENTCHDFHVERNQYNPNSKTPWLVENSLGCVVNRYSTEEEALKRRDELNEEASIMSW